MEFKDVIAEILTGLENGSFMADAEEGDWAKGDESFQGAVDVIAGLLDAQVWTKWSLLAAETFIRGHKSLVLVDEIDGYLDRHYRYGAGTVGQALEEYASGLGRSFELGRLYDALDRAGGASRFDWEGYADDGMTPTSGLHFIQVPAPAGESQVHIFES